MKMRVESEELKVKGYRLHRIIVHPEESIPVRAEAIFYHGQGGYADRYPDILEVFVKRGIRCIITDLPGHGQSSGRRGHAGNEDLLDWVIQASLEVMDDDLPYGVMGHSMGGLLTLRHLVLAGKGLLPEPSFGWVSSPLVDAGEGQPSWVRKAAHLLGPVVPWFTISTGVTSAMCRVVSDDEVDEISTTTPKPLWHNRVSLGWGVFLMKTSEWLQATADQVSENVPVLMTHGSDDPVCSPSKTQKLFDRLGSRNKTYLEIKGALHEPFSGAESGSLFAGIEKWLDEQGI